MHFGIDEEGWLAICFVIFVILAYKPLKNAISSFLDGKIARIRKETEEAYELKRQAEEELKILQQELTKLEQMHAEALVKIKQEFEQNFKNSCKEYDHSISYRRDAALESLEQLKKEATRKIEQGFLEIVLGGIERYTLSNQSSALDIAMLDRATEKQVSRKRELKEE